jgi:hypothetical protein
MWHVGVSTERQKACHQWSLFRGTHASLLISQGLTLGRPVADISILTGPLAGSQTYNVLPLSPLVVTETVSEFPDATSLTVKLVTVASPPSRRIAGRLHRRSQPQPRHRGRQKGGP